MLKLSIDTIFLFFLFPFQAVRTVLSISFRAERVDLFSLIFIQVKGRRPHFLAFQEIKIAKSFLQTFAIVFFRVIGRQLFVKEQSALPSLCKATVVIDFLILGQYLRYTTAVNASAKYGASSLYTSFRTLFAILSRPGAFPLGSFSSFLSNSVSKKSQGIVNWGSVLVLLKISDRSTSREGGQNQLIKSLALPLLSIIKGLSGLFLSRGR